VHIVWPTVVSEGHPQKAVFYSSTKDGRTFTPHLRLSRPDQEEAAHPQVAVGASGAVAAVWDEPHGGMRQVVFRAVGPEGQLGVGRTLSSDTTASHPVIAPVVDGFLVAWTSGEAAASAILLRRVGAGQPAGQPGQNKEHAFRGYVESVDPTGTVMVNGENVEGWMGPMTMMYGVDNKDVLGRLKVGDRISAKIYDGDFKTLHAVEILPR
jgi:Cu/Ag efflux protein CusF